MAVQGALLAPVVIAATLAVLFFPVALVVIAPAGVLYAYLLWRVGLRVATEDGNLRQPELILAVNPLKG
jgi:membrane protein implicated in regulation of membrane protease activity